jgi:hypothetical protein
MTRSQAPARDDMDVKATFRHREGEAGQDLTRCRRIRVEETVDKYETLDARRTVHSISICWGMAMVEHLGLGGRDALRAKSDDRLSHVSTDPPTRLKARLVSAVPASPNRLADPILKTTTRSRKAIAKP